MIRRSFKETRVDHAVLKPRVDGQSAGFRDAELDRLSLLQSQPLDINTTDAAAARPSHHLETALRPTRNTVAQSNRRSGRPIGLYVT